MQTITAEFGTGQSLPACGIVSHRSISAAHVPLTTSLVAFVVVTGVRRAEARGWHEQRRACRHFHGLELRRAPGAVGIAQTSANSVTTARHDVSRARNWLESKALHRVDILATHLTRGNTDRTQNPHQPYVICTLCNDHLIRTELLDRDHGRHFREERRHHGQRPRLGQDSGQDRWVPGRIDTLTLVIALSHVSNRLSAPCSSCGIYPL